MCYESELQHDDTNEKQYIIYMCWVSRCSYREELSEREKAISLTANGRASG